MATDLDKRICIGAGHVGLPLALVLADEGSTVDILDSNAEALRPSWPVGCLPSRVGDMDKAEIE